MTRLTRCQSRPITQKPHTGPLVFSAGGALFSANGNFCRQLCFSTSLCDVRFPPESGQCGELGYVRFVPKADIALSPGATHSFDVFDGYQAFRGSTLLLFESTVPTSLTQRLCPKASVTERPIALPPELVGAYAMQQSHIHDPPKPIDLPPHAQGAGVKCGLLVSSQPTSLTTINARLNVTDANIPSR